MTARLMNDDRHRMLVGLLQLFDLVLVTLAFGLTTLLIVHSAKDVSLGQFLAMRTRVSNYAIYLLALFSSHFAFSTCGLYRSRRLSKKIDLLIDLIKGTTLCVGCFVVLGALFSVRMFTSSFIALFWVLSYVILCAARFSLLEILASLRSSGKNLRHMLILGTNAQAVEFARRILSDRERGYRIVGFVDDDWPGMKNFKGSGFPLVTGYAGLAEFLRHNVVDEVAFNLPLGSFYTRLSEVANLCAHHGIIMRFNPGIFGLKNVRYWPEESGGDLCIATYTGTRELWPAFVKRVVDVAVSASLLVLLLPTFAIVSLLIKLTSHGPVFFRQERIGINKRRFRIYKFRTMVRDAEELMAKLQHRNEVSGPVFKIKNDPRVTPIGRFLRRSSIDELPQLLNVLKGDMSLVGPRPLPVRDYEGFSEDWQRRRFSVRPGITCLWQVQGRSTISFEQWMMLDLQYMDEWSLWLDFKILAQTVPAVLKGEGAA
jgi:exopolysaccharide biosynthesis polyprenyl glycosylphosphotransferase